MELLVIAFLIGVTLDQIFIIRLLVGVLTDREEKDSASSSFQIE